MFCRKCGREIPDDSAFCSKCGTPVELVVERKSEKQPEIDTKKDPETAKKKHSKSLTILIMGAIILFTAIGLAYYINASKANGEDEASAEVPVVVAEPTPAVEKVSIEEITASCLRIECYDNADRLEATGSGFIAFDNKTIVTNYHVIESRPFKIRAVTENGKTYTIDQILACNEDIDIAILHTREPSTLVPLGFSSEPVAKTDKVMAIGSPLGLLNVVSEGIVSGFTRIGDLSAIQFTASISHGSSGGVLINSAGEVVGVTFASFSEGQNLNIAIPIEYVDALYTQRTQADTISVFQFNMSRVYPINDILSNPKAFNMRVVNIQGYVSSCSPIIKQNTNNPEGFYIYFVNDADEVLGIDERGKPVDAYYTSDSSTIEINRINSYRAIWTFIPHTRSFYKSPKLFPGSAMTIRGEIFIVTDDSGSSVDIEIIDIL